MTKLVLFLLVFPIASVHACFNDAVNIYQGEMQSRHHQQISVYPQAKQLIAGESYETYGTIFSYDRDVEIYEGSSEFMSGFGVEAIVMDPTNCSLVDLVQVYAE